MNSLKIIMKKQIKKLEEFQKKFQSTHNESPTLIEEYQLRYSLLKEENEEYLEACNNKDLVGVLDALTDQLYVILGTIVSHGMQHIIEEAFQEVHNSNMSKLDVNGNPIINGENGYLDKTKPLGKILKSDGFFTPDLKSILERKPKPIFPIKKGDQFLCLEDYVMDDGQVAYTEGETYLSELDDCITDNICFTNHYMVGRDTPKYFKKL